jgi:hypothetical protein
MGGKKLDVSRESFSSSIAKFFGQPSVSRLFFHSVPLLTLATQ